MKKPFIVLTFVCSALLLSACFHSPALQPESYCHKLKTQINGFTPSNTNQHNVNAATRSALLQQYDQLDCEDQS